MLQKPFLASCANRTVLPKAHPTSFAPEDWFDNSVLQLKEYLGVSFDFFVNWGVTPNSLTPVVWIKRILSPERTYTDLLGNLEAELANEFGNDYLTRLSIFASNYHLTTQIVIFRDDFNWGDAGSMLLIVSLTNNERNIALQSEIISIGEFQNRIRQNSGGPVQIGAKGLLYGTSRMECFLSHTDSLYPGDADLILLDSANRPKAILEFKKHNLGTQIEAEQLSKYYPNPDARKYNRLAILRDHLSSHEKIPIIIVYYPTKPEFKIAKVELIIGAVGALSTKAWGKFDLPTAKSSEQFLKAIEEVQKAIDYHTKFMTAPTAE